MIYFNVRLRICFHWPLLSSPMLPFLVFVHYFGVCLFSNLDIFQSCNNRIVLLLYFHLATVEACCALKKSICIDIYTIKHICINVYRDLKYECLQI